MKHIPGEFRLNTETMQIVQNPFPEEYEEVVRENTRGFDDRMDDRSSVE